MTDDCDHPFWRGVTAESSMELSSELSDGGGVWSEATYYVIEQCTECGAYRKNGDPEYIDGPRE